MGISEQELRVMISIARNLVKVMEQALKSEQEKNEGRLTKQLINQGVVIDFEEELLEVPGTDEWAIGMLTGKTYGRKDDGSWKKYSGKLSLDSVGRFVKYEYEFTDDCENIPNSGAAPLPTDAFEL